MVVRQRFPRLSIRRYYDSDMDCGYGAPRSLSFGLLSNKSRQQGLTTKILKGHTSYVFCVNYNSASDKLVSGCCDGDIKIWDVPKGGSLSPLLVYNSFKVSMSRKVFEDPTRTFRLCHCRAFQPGRQPNCFVRLRRADVSRGIYSLPRVLTNYAQHDSRIWNSTTGQCLKTLAESQNAIWCVYALPSSI